MKTTTNKAKARVYNSSLINELLEEVTPIEVEQTKTKLQLAARIEDCMVEKGWSKTQFATQANKHPSEITKWLSGTHNFTIDVLTEIAYVLGVELAFLLGKTQHQDIYREKLVVKSGVVPVLIPIKTPLDKDVNYGNSFSATQKLNIMNPH